MLQPRDSSWRLRLRLAVAPALIFLIIMALTVGLMRIAYKFNSIDLRQNITQSCYRVVNVLESSMGKRVTMLLQLAHAFRLRTEITEEDFHAEGRFVMQAAPDIVAIINTGPTGLPIWIESGQDFVRPDTWRGRIGRDEIDQILQQQPVQTAMGRADTRLRKLAVTDKMPIGAMGDGFAVVIPYSKEDRPRGFIIALFLHSKLIDELYVQDLRGNFNIALKQGEGERFDQPVRGIEEDFFVGDQKWLVRVDPVTPPINSAYFTSAAILSLGTLLALIISLYMHHQAWRTAKLQGEYIVASSRLALTGLSLAEIQENLDLILSSVDEGIILYNDEMQPLQANAVFKRTFLSRQGASADSPAQDHHRAMASLFQNEAQYWALLNSLRENPERPLTDEIELRRLTESGAPRHFQRRAAVVTGPDGARRGYLVIYQDITHTRTVERLKEDFLSSVTHDLRTPLASIKGFAETLLRDHDMDRQTHDEFAGIIRSEARRLEEMIEDLLDLRRMEDGQMDLAPGAYNMRQLVEDVVRTSRPILDVQEIKVDLQWAGQSGQSLLGDSAKISRAIRNILSNSVKYAPPKSAIRIIGRESEDRVEVEIMDEGQGIPPDEIPHVFDKFYRGARHVRRTTGTGLGLAIVKHIIDSHGGVVSASNAPGGGACIKIVLPRELDRYRTPLPGTVQLDPGRLRSRERESVGAEV